MSRDRHKQINDHLKELNRKKQEMVLTKTLKKEVDTGANGTQKYTIKNGPNKGKVL